MPMATIQQLRAEALVQQSYADGVFNQQPEAPVKFWVLGMLVAAAMIGIAALATPSWAQHELPLDHHALFKTHVAHANSSIGGGGGGPSGTAQTSASASFSGAAYNIGSTVTPTNTLPEAEEHIAVDPNNSSNLLAATSDFSLRGGWNTTKY